MFNFDVLDDSEKIIFALRNLYKDYGYERYKMGKFEEYDLYARNKDFLVSDSVITFTDTNGKLLALKPDVTLSIIKNMEDAERGVTKICYNENVYRVSKGTGSFKEIMQTGLECLGNVDNDCIAEVLKLAAMTLAKISDDYALEVSLLDVTKNIVDDLTDDMYVRKNIMKCISEKNAPALKEVCEKNGIGDKDCGLLTQLISLYGPWKNVLPRLKELFSDGKYIEDIDNIEEILQSFAGTELEDKIQIDFSLIGDVKYYNNVIFKGFIEGIPGSVLQGGCYDNLMKRMRRNSKAIGFAVYLDMLDRINIGGEL